MILVLDIGNTNICLGLYKGDNLVFNIRLQSDKLMTADEYAAVIMPLLTIYKIDHRLIKAVMVSSVVPLLSSTIGRFSRRYLNLEPLVVNQNISSGITIKMDNPLEVGADRLVNTVATKSKYGYPSIVVDFGTATTFDVISISGDYIGGIIAPGVKLSIANLHQKTAMLPEVEIIKPTTVIGTTTTKAIQSGIYYGYLDLVNGLIDRIITEEFHDYAGEVNIVLTGGLSNIFIDNIKHKSTYEPNLTLFGLKLIYDRSAIV